MISTPSVCVANTRSRARDLQLPFVTSAPAALSCQSGPGDLCALWGHTLQSYFPHTEDPVVNVQCSQRCPPCPQFCRTNQPRIPSLPKTLMAALYWSSKGILGHRGTWRRLWRIPRNLGKGKIRNCAQQQVHAVRRWKVARIGRSSPSLVLCDLSCS